MLTRGLFAILALVFTGTAAAGAVLPGLPTVPFLLAAAACGRRGWPALATRIESHPRWGVLLNDWRHHGMVPRHAKWAAGMMMLASWSALAMSGSGPGVLLMAGVGLGAVLAWLWGRPERGQPGQIYLMVSLGL